MKVIGESYEIIFVNDGSRDKSLEILESLYKNDDNIKIIDFSRNFGHQIAITAGIEHTQGKAVIVMDADLQHPPELIPEMIKKWKEGFDIVYTIREKTVDEGFIKKITSNIFYKILNKIANINISENAPDFRLLDQKVVDSLKSIKERARFIRGLINWVGFSQTGIRFIAPKRYTGKTKYSLGKMLKFSIDGITSFSSFPLKIASHFGFILSSLGFLYAVYAIYMKLFSNSVIQGWTSILITVLILSGVQLITIGIIGEYISRIYEESKQRPLYITKKTLGFGDSIKAEQKK
jgi:glycosyltransferase involved in cell wall biosynthesis